MRDTELYRHLLGLVSPWTVGKVELDVNEQRVDVWVRHPKGLRWPCPVCAAASSLYDHSEERVWRHLDSCQFLTYLHACPPRVKCSEHGVLQVKLPWAEPMSRFTALFERLAIDVLRETDVLGATRIFRISWDEAWRIMERAVKRGQSVKESTVCRHIGVDEKAAAKGHKYLTLVCDLDRGTVEHISDGRKQESLDSYYQSLSDAQLEGIEGIAMDMWIPYFQSTMEHVPAAEDKVVFDRFHIMKHMGDAVDTVRRKEHRALQEFGDDSLKGTKDLWLYAEENLPDRYKDRFATIKAITLKTSRAWAIKESLRGLWKYTYRAWAMKYWKRWYFWATHSRLAAVIKVAKMIKSHLVNVLTFCAHRITNAVSEGLNSKIQTIKKMSYGFRNREHFKTAISFHCGGLQLYPVTHGNVG